EAAHHLGGLRGQCEIGRGAGIGALERRARADDGVANRRRAALARLHGYGLSSEATGPEAVSVSSAQVYRYDTRFVFPGGARAWPRTTGLPTHGRTQQVGEYPAPSRGPGAAARPGGGGGGAGGGAERALGGGGARRRGA